ncbi:hypothetical protein WR25_19732 [Diploscapter pachys]|jgi:hypothetical protein|uniref:Secreted protein n=1 Tax=Diploscapter pachys TaxID=2018661 RepID=A0A2A2K6H3_9BILA|nr:hypothetical protein WR25_19732 [Diploscapter pachys]
MRPLVAIETVALRAALMPLVVLEVSALPRCSNPMWPDTAAALNATHTTTSRHRNRKVDTDRLPQAVCPKFAFGGSGHRLFHWQSKACT